MLCTDKSFSEALILASTNPQYDKRLFIELPVQHMKNMLSYCGLIDAKIRASDKDLPVHVIKGVSDLEMCMNDMLMRENLVNQATLC